MKAILLNALHKALCWAIVGGLAYWAGVQWVEYYGPSYAPSTIVTEETYIVFAP